MNATATHPDATVITLRRPPLFVTSANQPSVRMPRMRILGTVTAATHPQTPSNSVWQARLRRSLSL